MAATPSFFLLSDDDGADTGGAWTKVQRKSNKKKCKEQGSKQGSRRLSGGSAKLSSNASNASSRRNSFSSVKSVSSKKDAALTPTTKELRSISWRVPHEPESFSSHPLELMREEDVEDDPSIKQPKRQTKAFFAKTASDPGSFASKAAAKPHQQQGGLIGSQAAFSARGDNNNNNSNQNGRVVSETFPQTFGPTSQSQRPPSVASTGGSSLVMDETLQTKVDENNREKMRVKIWNILFRNVNRTIDELYYMCEVDSSEQHCKNAEELLETYLNEFKELKERLQNQSKFIPLDRGEVDRDFAPRETSRGLAWEVRKGNPSPSPITLLFGSQLRQESTATVIAENSNMTILKRRSLKELTFSSSMVNKEWDTTPSEDDGKCGPLSAWAHKPTILSNHTNLPDLDIEHVSHSVQLEDHSLPMSSEENLAFEIDSPRGPEVDMISLTGSDMSDIQTKLVFGETPLDSPSGSTAGSLFGDEDTEETLLRRSKSSTGDVFTFDDLSGMSSRWGDEVVGLTEDAVALVSPRRKRACDVCARFVLSYQSEGKMCSSCITNAAARLGNSSSRDLMMRSLHEKLSSPERRKPSPFETKRRQVEKQTTARLNREKIDLQRQAKLRLQSSRQEQIAKVKEEVILAQERAISEKLERAAVAREAKLKSVAKKAENESLKVNEIQFINEMTEQEKTAQMHKRLEDGEKRRLEFIGTIREKAEKQNERVEATRLREEDKERQLREAIQKRHEEAVKRKAEALEEQRRKIDEATAKVNERRTEMEKEREARFLLIKEREERAEQERLRHLMAKRTAGRGSTASPLLSGTAHPPSPCCKGRQDDPVLASSVSANSEVAACESGYPENLPEDGQLSSAEDENRTLEGLDSQEKAMKKTLKKTKGRLAALCSQNSSAAAKVVKASALLVRNKQLCSTNPGNVLAQSCRSKIAKSLDGIMKGKLQGECVQTLLKYVKDYSMASMVYAKGESGLLHLLDSALERETFIKHPRDSSAILELVSRLCDLNSSLALVLAFKNYLPRIVDLCVHLLRDSTGEDSVSALANGIWIVRVAMGTVAELSRAEFDSKETSAFLASFNIEMARICIFSSLVLRASERCTQIKCGKRWMGCAMPNSSETCEHQDGSSSPGCKHVGGAVDLVRSNLGLIEVMAFVAISSPFSDENTQMEVLLMDTARSSSLFRVVSQLVAVFIAVEGIKDYNRPVSEDASVAKKDLESRRETSNARGWKTPTLKENLKAAAQSGLRILNLLSCLDLQLVQDILGSPALPFELQQVFRYILASCRDRTVPEDMPKPPQQTWEVMSQHLVKRETKREELFAELIVLMGFYARSNEKNQESLNWGRSPTPLTRLCRAPFAWFASSVGKSILFPTLLSICSGNEHALGIISEELSPMLLQTFLSKQQTAGSDEAPMIFCKRFPRELWETTFSFLNAYQ